MEFLFKILLNVHIVCGTLSLLIGTWIMIKKKGDNMHKQLGKMYMWSMVINGLASFYLSIYHPNYFLFIVGIFSIYMALSGYRIMKLRRIDGETKPQYLDWILSYTMALFGLGFLLFGVYNLYMGSSFGFVFIAFALISGLFVFNDYKYYNQKQEDKKYWMLNHISKMVGSYIAAFTAFLVVNNTILHSVFVWLLPTVVGTGLIIKWRKKYGSKS